MRWRSQELLAAPVWAALKLLKKKSHQIMVALLGPLKADSGIVASSGFAGALLVRWHFTPKVPCSATPCTLRASVLREAVGRNRPVALKRLSRVKLSPLLPGRSGTAWGGRRKAEGTRVAWKAAADHGERAIALSNRSSA